MIQVLHRALDILELIAQNPKRELSNSEIATKLKLNQGTCANIIKTMVGRNYLSQSGKRKGYKLGTMAYYLTGNYSQRDYLINASKEVMQMLTRSLNESTIIAIKHKNIRIVLHEEKAHNELQVFNYPEKPVYNTSTGRLLLAFIDEEELDEFIEKYGFPEREIWKEVENKEGLKIELRKIQEKSIAIQISKQHIAGIAVPIWKNEKVVASLGVYLPELRLKENNREFIIESLKDAGEKISKKLNVSNFSRIKNK